MSRQITTLSVLAVLMLGAWASVCAADRPDTVRTVFTVEGMHCDGCSSTITGTLERMEGVVSAQADHAAGSAEAVYNSKKVRPSS